MDQDALGPIGPNRATVIETSSWAETDEPGQSPRRPAIGPVIIYVVLILFIGIGSVVLFFPGLIKKNDNKNNAQAVNVVSNTNIGPAVNPTLIANVVQRINNLNTSSNRAQVVTPPAENTNSFYFNADTDKDGVLDRIEIREGTNPRQADTDQDGLTDFQEIYLYYSNPNKPDTDGDSYLDGPEVKNGYNPNGPGRLP